MAEMCQAGAIGCHDRFPDPDRGSDCSGFGQPPEEWVGPAAPHTGLELRQLVSSENSSGDAGPKATRKR